MNRRVVMSLFIFFVVLVLSVGFFGCKQNSDGQDDDDDDDNDDDDNHGEDEAAVYRVIQIDDPLAQLYSDAEALGLDISNASLEEDHSGWWIIGNDKFEIRRLLNSGYFNYINKKTEYPNYPVGEEPVSESEIETRALNLLHALGIPVEQMSGVSIDRMVQQDDDSDLKETVSFLVTVNRRIDDIKVMYSEAEVAFNAEGELHLISTSWRRVDPEPVRYEEIIGEEELRQIVEELLDSISNGSELTLFSGRYAYVEGPYKEIQEEFTLVYIYMYSFGDFLWEESIPATR